MSSKRKARGERSFNSDRFSSSARPVAKNLICPAKDVEAVFKRKTGSRCQMPKPCGKLRETFVVKSAGRTPAVRKHDKATVQGLDAYRSTVLGSSVPRRPESLFPLLMLMVHLCLFLKGKPSPRQGNHSLPCGSVRESLEIVLRYRFAQNFALSL